MSKRLHFTAVRQNVIDFYPNSKEWKDKVLAMKPRQIFAIYRHMQKTNPTKFNETIGGYHQMSLLDIFGTKPEEGEYHQMTIAEYLQSTKETK